VNAPKRIQDQEILISGNDRGALAGHGGCQHEIVVAVATRRGIEHVRRHERERLGKQLQDGPHINRTLAELPFQDFKELVQQQLRRHDDVMADAVFEEIAAGAARNEGSDQHVRIQEKFHETRVNTSSSV
jgi:D-alanyl-D-alanine carboxypeptidase